MSKKTIGTLYAISVLLEFLVLTFALGASTFFIGLIFLHINAETLLIGLLVCAFAGWVVGLIAWIGALINFGKAQAWTFFVLTFFFGGIMILIYLFGGGPQPAPAPFPHSRTRSTYKYGAICGVTLAALAIFCTALLAPFCTHLLSNFWQFNLSTALIVNTLLAVCLSIISTLPVLFWAGKRAARQTGLAKAGSRVARHAYFWMFSVEAIYILLDLTGLLFLLVIGRVYPFPWGYAALSWLLSLIVPLLLLSGVGVVLDRMYGNLAQQSAPMNGPANPQPYQPQPAYAPFSSSPQQPQLANAPFGPQPYQPQLAYMPPGPQPYQPQQPLSALEILQQRYARGEIDMATFEQMRNQLKRSY